MTLRLLNLSCVHPTLDPDFDNSVIALYAVEAVEQLPPFDLEADQGECSAIVWHLYRTCLPRAVYAGQFEHHVRVGRDREVIGTTRAFRVFRPVVVIHLIRVDP